MSLLLNLINFTYRYGVSILDFGQVNTGWNSPSAHSYFLLQVVLHEDKAIELHMLKKGFQGKPGQVRTSFNKLRRFKFPLNT